ncbi:GntR family transcriptional regulator [Virgibacillus halophilus]|uniref:GntR family transcriptional regulator n=1 Tax=Tigheibacillus halophilus TaxID=361280 RepID=A0ABU5C6Q3_9BACI|nr:GntR family transcriptional regulator [Virgibacillus halophilus]
MKALIYHHLKDAILSRQLPPGKQLVENEISTMLQVSRTPIRSAINLLAEEGLVDIKPNKGAFVTNPTREEIVQAYDLRKRLEIMAASMAVRHLNANDFITMEECIQMEKEAIFSRNIKGYLQANQDFHMVYTKKCGNPFLIDFIEKLINQTAIYLILFDMVFDKESSARPYGYKEHWEIMEFFRERKLEKIISSLERHFDHAVESLQIQHEYKDLKGIFQ